MVWTLRETETPSWYLRCSTADVHSLLGCAGGGGRGGGGGGAQPTCPGAAHLSQPSLQLQHSALVALLLLAHLLQVLLQLGVLGLQLPGLRLQVELLLAELRDHLLLGFPADSGGDVSWFVCSSPLSSAPCLVFCPLPLTCSSACRCCCWPPACWPRTARRSSAPDCSSWSPWR